jgi:hypothetical protein
MRKSACLLRVFEKITFLLYLWLFNNTVSTTGELET